MIAVVPRLRLLCFVLFSALSAPSAVKSDDWIHWRGPEENGYAKGVDLPDAFGVTEPGKDNLIWKSPVGGRSAPLVMNGLLYLITADGDGVTQGERVVCLSADTGKPVWEQKFRVFHTDIVASRLGWTSLTADPAAGTVFCHGTQGHVYCFDGKSGAIKWRHNLTEEYGRVTGYGGRIVSPIFDSGLVIVGMVSSSWGNHARGANRYVAFDGKTGEVVWWAETPAAIKGTYYSNPVVAVVGGQRLLVTGGADGYVHAFKVRTGERVWSYPFSAGVVNPSPVADGSLVYFAHGEENPGGGPLGKVICLDAAKVDPKTKQPKVVWETKRIQLATGGSRQNIRFGLASPALAEGILYVPDDAGELYAFEAKTGKGLWTYKYGTVSRGAPLVADGKLYVFDVLGRLAVLKLNGNKPPTELELVTFRPASGTGVTETNGTPIAVNNKLYFSTRENTYGVGKADAKAGGGKYQPLPEEAKFDPAATPAAIRIVPADVAAAPGQAVKFQAQFLDANGREVKAPAGAKVEWSLPTPPPPPNSKANPPALKGELKPDGVTAAVTPDKTPSQQGYVGAKAGNLTAPLARVRVVPQIPYTQDFEKTPEGIPPSGWVNATSKYYVKKLPDGNKVLAKVNDNSRPPIARANAYITAPSAAGYTIEADLMGTEVRGRLPDMGIVNSRYLLVLDGKPDPELGGKRTLRLISWEALPRVNKGAAFDWKPGTWYRLKLEVEPKGSGAVIKGKAWPKGEAEPKDWTVTFDDPAPNTEGAAALYGYVTNMREVDKETPNGVEQVTEPGSEIYYDNLSITPAGKK